MKKLLYLLIALLPVVGFSSCEREFTHETFSKDIPATHSEIIGSWSHYNNGTYQIIVFDESTYEILRLNVFTPSPYIPTTVEKGIYVMEGVKVKLTATEGTSAFKEFEVYWIDKKSKKLYIYPLGDFTPYTPPVIEPEEAE